jgi:ABC-2 type transport system ATP-binding protein
VAAGGIAAMLQDCGLMPGVTIAELMELGRRLYPAPMSAAEALELAGLGALARRRVDRLSGGQAQRLKFALVAVANADIMLLDEPTRALDVQGRREFWTAMRAFAASGRTVVFATHYLDEVEENADRVVVLAHGRIIADGTPAEIRTGSGSAVVRFRVVLGQDPEPGLRSLPGAEVTIEGDRVTIRTDDSDATVRALAADPLPWHDLSVIPPSLDDSFLQLTSEESR